jgi:hypothetical protein
MKYCCLDLFEKNDGECSLMEEIGIVSLGHLPNKEAVREQFYFTFKCAIVPCLPPLKSQKDGEKRERREKQEKQARTHKIQR